MAETVPNFLIIGAPKAGTTSLWHHLRKHPDIFMPVEKEARFFSHRYDKGWPWYRALFSDAATASAVGEASPHYSMVEVFPQTLPRIAADLPHARLIYCIRDPFTALPSAWKQYLYRGTTMPDRHRMPGSFPQALKKWPPLLATVRYWSNLSAFRTRFPDAQILVVFFEQLQARPHDVLRECFAFLGVAPDFPVPNLTEVRNASQGKLAMPAAYSRVRHTAPMRILRRLTPAHWKRTLRRLVLRPLPGQCWDAESLAYAYSVLDGEIRGILSYTGRDRSEWHRPRNADAELRLQ